MSQKVVLVLQKVNHNDVRNPNIKRSRARRWQTNLSRETDEFERFVLAPAAQDIRERAEGILVNWRTMSRLTWECDIEQRDGECQNAVDENEKLRIFELSDVSVRVFVLSGHDLLLQDAPGEVGHLKSDEAEDQI